MEIALRDLPAEWDFVLSCARAALRAGAETAPSPGLPDAPFDWRRAASVACKNRVAPLVYSTLSRLAPPAEAQAALTILRNAYVATAARNAVLFRALKEVLEGLTTERMPLIVLKGAALAETVYRERALRPMADIDLLVRKEDLAEAEHRLRGLGYEAAHDPQTKEELRKRHHHWVFRSARPTSGGIPIELHWNLDPPGRQATWDMRALFERAAPASIAGADALVLSRGDFLLHLCLHLCRHRFHGGAIALCDIAATVSHHGERLDWTEFERLAAAADTSEYAFVPLCLAADLMGAGVPASVLGSLGRSGGGHRVLELARGRILEEKGDLRGAAELLLRWRGRSWGGRAAAARRSLLPARTSVRRRTGRNPDGLSSFGLAHLADLLRRYAPWLSALIRHRRVVASVAEREARRTELDSWCESGVPPSHPR